MRHAKETRPRQQHRRPAAERAAWPSETAAFARNRPGAIAQRKLAEAIDRSPRAIAQRALIADIQSSPFGVAQRKRFGSLFGEAAQFQGGPDQEELLQGKFQAIQRQGPDEEELLQGKLAPVQRAGTQEEELLQGKFAAVQLLAPEEEELQMKQAAGTESPAQFEPDPALRKNDTGLPDNLKFGIESLSGMSMDNVNVHYNSAQPAQLDALAYAQGTDIHVAPGQEQHLPHEAWHVVQQAQGRVRPTKQMKDGVPVNDDQGLEREADVMGAKAATQESPHRFAGTLFGASRTQGSHATATQRITENVPWKPVAQMRKIVDESAQKHYNDGWGKAYGIQDDKTLKTNVNTAGNPGGWTISLGKFDNPTEGTYNRACTLGYKNVNGRRETFTYIKHCGPSSQGG